MVKSAKFSRYEIVSCSAGFTGQLFWAVKSIDLPINLLFWGKELAPAKARARERQMEVCLIEV